MFKNINVNFDVNAGQVSVETAAKTADGKPLYRYILDQNESQIQITQVESTSEAIPEVIVVETRSNEVVSVEDTVQKSEFK